MKKNLLLSCCLVLLASCALVKWVGIKILYRHAALPSSQVLLDIPYWQGPGANPKRNNLNLFLPEGHGWPILVFIPGGGWTTEDKDLTAVGADVYGNIGRFFAARGIGVAIINYRLIPDVVWTAQIRDTARAVAWIHSHISTYGGDPKKIFLSGHSAGAQLATRLALDPSALRDFSLSNGIICGVIAVSGAAYELTDGKTFTLGAKIPYYAERFQNGDTTDSWRTLVSPLRYLQGTAPPFLIMHAEGDPKSLHRQSELLHEKLTERGIKNTLTVIPGETHIRIVLTLSHPDKAATPAMLNFINETKCE